MFVLYRSVPLYILRGGLHECSMVFLHVQQLALLLLFGSPNVSIVSPLGVPTQLPASVLPNGSWFALLGCNVVAVRAACLANAFELWVSDDCVATLSKFLYRVKIRTLGACTRFPDTWSRRKSPAGYFERVMRGGTADRTNERAGFGKRPDERKSGRI